MQGGGGGGGAGGSGDWQGAGVGAGMRGRGSGRRRRRGGGEVGGHAAMRLTRPSQKSHQDHVCVQSSFVKGGTRGGWPEGRDSVSSCHDVDVKGERDFLQGAWGRMKVSEFTQACLRGGRGGGWGPRGGGAARRSLLSGRREWGPTWAGGFRKECERELEIDKCTQETTHMRFVEEIGGPFEKAGPRHLSKRPKILRCSIRECEDPWEDRCLDACRLPLPPAACRLPPACLPAACRLPPAACRLPPAACPSTSSSRGQVCVVAWYWLPSTGAP